MAIYHASMKAMGRGQGRSGSAAAAYRAGLRVEDPHTGRVYDYTRRHGVEAATMLAPKDAPAWARDAAQVWARSDALATRKNARTAREVEVSLPAELSADQSHALALDLGQRAVDRWGVGALVAEHAPSERGDDRNHHVHILLTPRVLGAAGFGDRAMREFDGRNGQGQAAVAAWREDIADTINRHLERAGVAARVDHRSLADQAREALGHGEVLRAGALARTPTQHEGKTNTAARRGGRLLDRAQANEQTKESNVIGMQDWIQEHLTAPAAVAIAEVAGREAQAAAPAGPTADQAEAAAKAAEGKADAAKAVAGKATRDAVAAPRVGSAAPARVSVGRATADKAHGGASKEQKQEASRAAEAAALINQAGAAAEAVAQEYIRGVQAAGAEVSAALKRIAAMATMVAAQSHADLLATQAILQREVAARRRCREIERQEEAAKRAAKMVEDAKASKWRREDRLETWRHKHPRPGLLHPIRRGAWDTTERQALAGIDQAERAREKASAGVLGKAAWRALEYQAEMADQHRREVEEERDRWLGQRFSVGGAHGQAGIPTSTDHSLDPVPDYPAPRQAGTAPTTPGAPETEEQRRRRRRRRAGGHGGGA